MAKRVRTKFQTLCIDFQQSNNGPKRILPRGQPIPVVAGRFDGTGQKQKVKQNGNGASLEGNPPLRESTGVVGTDGPKVPAVPKYSDILSGKAKAPPKQTTALTPAQKSSAAGYGANPGQSDKNKNAILSASQKAKTKRKNDPLWCKKKPSKYLPKLEDFIMIEPVQKKTKSPKTKDVKSKKTDEQSKLPPAGNPLLAHLNIQYKRGHIRAKPKTKKTKLKRIILESRVQRKQQTKSTEPEGRLEPPPHKRKFRQYCKNLVTPELNDSVTDFLTVVKTFQDRVYQQDPHTGLLNRRTVCGLREALRDLSLEKVKCVIVAPDVERVPEEDGPEDKIGRIQRLCEEQNLPCIFALSKKNLARIVRKKFVSVVAVLNFHGAENQYKEVMRHFESAREGYDNFQSELLQSSTSADPKVCSINELEQKSCDNVNEDEKKLPQSSADHQTVSSHDQKPPVKMENIQSCQNPQLPQQPPDFTGQRTSIQRGRNIHAKPFQPQFRAQTGYDCVKIEPGASPRPCKMPCKMSDVVQDVKSYVKCPAKFSGSIYMTFGTLHDI